MITDRNQVCFAKMVGCGLQEEVNEATVQYVGVVLDPLKPRISVKIVSGVERSAIPDTIKMSEAAAR